ncbi:MAG: glycosyltransferase family 39 protein [Planctomycetota bacterium]
MNRALAASLLLLLLLAWSAWLMARGLDRPFENDMHGGNGAFYSLVARNFRRYPVAQLAGVMCIEPGASVREPAIYTHHPPMIGWLVWLSFALFGEGEWQARVVTLVLALLAVIALFVWLRAAFPDSLLAPFTATVLTWASPIAAHYATMPDPQGAGVMLAMFVALGGAARWQRDPRARHLVVVQLGLAFGYLFDWPAFLTALMLTWWLWCSREPRARHAAAWVGGGVLACGTVLLAWLAFMPRGPLPSLGQAFLERTAAGLDDLSIAQALRQILVLHARAFSLPTSIAGLIALVWLVACWRRPATDRSHALLLIPLGTGVCHVLLFLGGAAIHDYWQIYLAPGLALPAAWAVARMARWGPRWQHAALAASLALALTTSVAAVRFSERERAAGASQALELKQLGLLLNRRVALEGYVAVPMPRCLPLLYYADRKTVWRFTPAVLADVWQSLGVQLGAVVLGAAEQFLDTSPLVRAGWSGPVAVGRYRVWTRDPP